jgi:aspartokinase
MNLVAMSADGVSCTQDGDDSLSSIVEDLSKLGTVTTERHRAIIGCVGADLNTTTAQAANARRILNEIDPTLNWRSTSISNLIAVVNAANVDQAVKNLHQGIFECD